MHVAGDRCGGACGGRETGVGDGAGREADVGGGAGRETDVGGDAGRETDVGGWMTVSCQSMYRVASARVAASSVPLHEQELRHPRYLCMAPRGVAQHSVAWTCCDMTHGTLA
eukprot:351427-Chlamydomonas_euryale.AAC.4